ncbi:inhibitor of apoptosis-promoting Bax1 [Ureibacillus chungkukjangi]|uniref:Inhibitor of apoptosis-promoting Bax1 n=1 Tax=Ureibacillus chungkukjangi TaxID=1202712 RepID=A0A318TMN8_9BACL|nr:inhibitor of apoptosis-promoting Bax1 [Ureibacillus chungkukjangi]
MALLLPLSIVIILSLLGIALVVLTFLMRLGNFIIFLIPILFGVLHFLLLIIFIDWLGAALIISVFIATLIIFISIAFMGIKLIEYQISEALMYAFTILIVFVVFAFIYIFIPVSSPFFLVVAGIFVLAFALYTVYEMDSIRNNLIRENEVLFYSLRLYLNLAYILINILISSRKR